MQLIEDGREPVDLRTTPLHLGPGSRARPVQGFSWAPEALEAYTEAVAADGAEGRLVTIFDGDGPGEHAERHPAGDEVVICLSGRVRVVRHPDDPGNPGASGDEVVLEPGEATVNPAGVWHTVDTDGPSRMLTITAGLGSEHRPRA